MIYGQTKCVYHSIENIVSIIIKISFFFIQLVAILKIAAILDSTILIICLHVFACVSVQQKLYTFNFNYFLIITIKFSYFFQFGRHLEKVRSMIILDLLVMQVGSLTCCYNLL